jgi:hypothetical protein
MLSKRPPYQTPRWFTSPLRSILEQGSITDGSFEKKRLCMLSVNDHVLSARDILATARPHTAILSLEYALAQLGNAVALIYDRTLENKDTDGGAHILSAAALVAYCREQHPEMADEALFAGEFVAKRNDYAYRHIPIGDKDLRRFEAVVSDLHSRLRSDIAARQHRPLPA